VKTPPPRLKPALTLRRSRNLRRDQSDAESKLWFLLRDRKLCEVKFRRQHPIGRFIVDFCCLERHLIVELDGGQHAEQKAKEADIERATFLRSKGYRVLRFWNHEVLLETEEVLERIFDVLKLG
jgi:very-short-patch-repair endonuclease